MTSGKPVIEVVNLKKYFPVRAGLIDLIMRRPRLYIKAVDGKVRVSIIIEMYIKTRFGITPITFEYTNLLPILQL